MSIMLIVIWSTVLTNTLSQWLTSNSLVVACKAYSLYFQIVSLILSKSFPNKLAWHFQIVFNCFTQDFDGVSDENTPVTRMFPHPVFAESIRINPTAWNVEIALRFEVLGCDGKYKIPRNSNIFWNSWRDNRNYCLNIGLSCTRIFFFLTYIFVFFVLKVSSKWSLMFPKLDIVPWCSFGGHLGGVKW